MLAVANTVARIQSADYMYRCSVMKTIHCMNRALNFATLALSIIPKQTITAASY